MCPFFAYKNQPRRSGKHRIHVSLQKSTHRLLLKSMILMKYALLKSMILTFFLAEHIKDVSQKPTTRFEALPTRDTRSFAAHKKSLAFKIFLIFFPSPFFFYGQQGYKVKKAVYVFFIYCYA